MTRLKMMIAGAALVIGLAVGGGYLAANSGQQAAAGCTCAQCTCQACDCGAGSCQR